MTQPPYHPPEGHPMRRFAIFATVLVAIIIVGSQPWKANASKKSWCTCVPSRAGLFLRSLSSTASVTKTGAASKQASTTAATVSTAVVAKI